ncbi:hypothetical protein [Galbibacter sp. PAP.153]
MKKTLSLLLIVLITATSFAQEKNKSDRKDRTEKREKFKSFYSDLTPDQIAELKTKRMALALDLTDAQQKEVLSLNKDLATKHKAKIEAWKAKKNTAEKPTKDERYAMLNAQLDEQLAVQGKMKKILDNDQYESWKKSKKQMHHKFRKKMYGK